MARLEMQKPFDPNSPRDWAHRWRGELQAAKEHVEKWHQDGEKIYRRFLDEREAAENFDVRCNYFTSNVITQQCLLYGKTPQVSVDRRFADARDDEARVAGEIIQRMLNGDVESVLDGFSSAIRHALDDFLLPGLGVARVRYEVETEVVKGTPAKVRKGVEVAPAVPDSEKKTLERVITEYVHWKDFLHSPARVWEEVRWVAFRIQLTRDALVEKFGKLGEKVKISTPSKKKGEDDDTPHPEGRATVWEIWSKEHKQVFWLAEGLNQVLVPEDAAQFAAPGGGIEDVLELEGFFPCPRPMAANATTRSFIPRPDYILHQDLYRRIDELGTRIELLVDAIRAAGVYDKTAGSVKSLLNGSKRNELIPVDKWAMHAEKGGLKGIIDWLPLEQIVTAIVQLDARQLSLIDKLHQVTGMSDIMRGQASSPGTTATEQGIEAKFGSVRMQSKQDEFARFASDLQKLKFEIISTHFDEATLVERSNAQYTFEEPGTVQKAVALIKSQAACYRVQVKPENVSLTDFAALKQEKMEVLAGVGEFLQRLTPLIQANPAALPQVLRLLQWGVAGLRGAATIEGVLDQAIAQAEQAAQNPQPAQQDPKLVAVQAKAQGDLQKVQAELQADLVRTEAEVQADAQREQNQALWNVREAQQKQVIANASRAANPNTKPIGGTP